MGAETAIETDPNDGVPFSKGPMASALQDKEIKEAELQSSTSSGKSWFVVRIVLVAMATALITGSVLHFIQFTRTVSKAEQPATVNADAIVVLTGGQARVAEAVRLLEEGHGNRLLISGVHPGTTRKQLAAVTASNLPLEANTVDLDRVALNTAGNAVETANWVRKNGFSSLLVVTSAYHLPRAVAELSGALPEVELIGYPVFSKELDLSQWYKNLETSKLLIREYVKYMVARLRLTVQDAG